MREEIAAAVVFISRVLRENNGVSKEQLAVFSDNLSAILVERFKNHWHTEKPMKGQGYRCVRLATNQHHDPVLRRAASQSNLQLKHLSLPVELVLWVDPMEVTCRFGEHQCNQCIVACFKEGHTENNALTLDISCMVEKHREEEEKNLKFLATRINKQHTPHNSKCYSPTEWLEKGCFDSDKEGYKQLWLSEDSADPYHYFIKDVRDKRVYIKQQNNSTNRHHQAQVFNSRYHYHNPQKQNIFPSSSSYSRSNLSDSQSVQHVHVSTGGTTYYRPVVKNRYQWVRNSNSSTTIAA